MMDKANREQGVGNDAGARVWRRNHLVLVVITIFFLLLACRSANNLFSGEINPLASPIVDGEGVLRLAGGQPRTLDPATTYGGPSGPIGAIFSGLVRLSPDLQVEPDLAGGWEVTEDGTLYRFYLRENATFHDGRPVTADDVIFSWERALDPSTGSDTVMTYLGDIVGAAEMNLGNSDHVSGLEAINDHILEVRIDSSKVYFLSKLTYPVTYVTDRHNVSQTNWEREPNGTGPFRLKQWSDDEILILERFERYYGTLPELQQVVYLMGAGIPLSMYEKGEIDLVGIGGSTLERVQDPNNELFPDLRIGPNMCTTYIGFNNQAPPFDDPLVRQAFSYALDREKLISGLYKGNALLAQGILPPGMPGYSHDIDSYSFDPEKAAALLAEAGYQAPSELPDLTYMTAGYGRVGGLETAVITMWQENLGVTIEPLLVEPYNYLDELFAGNIGNMFTSGWCADYPDPENFLDILFHTDSSQNMSGFSDRKIDALLVEVRSETETDRRIALYQDIEQQIVSAAPMIFMAHSISAELVKSTVEGYQLTPIGVPQFHLISKEN